MANMTNFLENQLAKHIFGTGTYSKPATIAFALTTSHINDAVTGTLGGFEIPNSNGYARQVVTQSQNNFTEPGADGIVYNLVAIEFPAATTADHGWISGIAVCDSATHNGGNCLIHASAQPPKYIGVGDIFRISVSGAAFTFM